MTATTSQGTDRVVDLLEVLASAHRPLNATDVASALGVHRSVAYRALQALTARRLVYRDDDGKYSLGIGLMMLANAAAKDFQEFVNAELASLANAVRASVMFSVDSEDGVMCLTTAEPRNAEMHLAVRLAGHSERIDERSPAAMAMRLGRPATADEPGEIAAARAKGYIEGPSLRWPGITLLAAPVLTAPGHSNASICVLYGTGTRDIDVDVVLGTAATLSDHFLSGGVSLPFEPGPLAG